MKIDDIPRRDDKLVVLERALDIMPKNSLTFEEALTVALHEYANIATIHGMRNQTALGPDTVAIVRDHPERLFGGSKA